MTVATRIEQRLRRWAWRRQGRDSDPLILHARRIYILPTGRGLAFGAMTFAMLLGSMNYNNNMGFALTFLLAGLGLVTMYHCHHNLLSLELRFAGAEPVFAGQQAKFVFALNNPDAISRHGLVLSTDTGHSAQPVDLPAGGYVRAEVAIPAERRGRLQLDHFRIGTRFPLGLCRAWTWVHLETPACIVYPHPADDAGPEPAAGAGEGGSEEREGDEDFAGLRSYRPSDSPRHIAWKAYARQEALLVKQYSGSEAEQRIYDYAQTTAAGTERRLSQLARWIVDAQARGLHYGLRMPDSYTEPASGPQHLRRCLTRLALFEG